MGYKLPVFQMNEHVMWSTNSQEFLDMNVGRLISIKYKRNHGVKVKDVYRIINVCYFHLLLNSSGVPFSYIPISSALYELFFSDFHCFSYCTLHTLSCTIYSLTETLCTRYGGNVLVYVSYEYYCSCNHCYLCRSLSNALIQLLCKPIRRSIVSEDIFSEFIKSSDASSSYIGLSFSG